MKLNSEINKSPKGRYSGETALNYDRKREKRKKWKLEMAALKQITRDFKAGTTILDVPLGTGRFLPIYRGNGHRVIGIDLSSDMLQMAKSKLGSSDQLDMIIARAQHIPLADKSVDYVVCIRLLNWVNTTLCQDIIREFNRVARKGVAVGFRSQRNIRLGEFVRMFLFDLIPTPHHLRRWNRLLVVFWQKARGKIKHMLTSKVRDQKNRKVQNRGSASTFHNREDIISLFSELDMELKQSFYIDSLASYSRKKIRPYSIFWARAYDPLQQK